MIYIFAVAITAGCMSEQKIMFKHYESENANQKKVTYYLSIPKNYRIVTFQASGEAGAEQQYWYPDSSVIYITSMEGLPTINQDNIKSQEGASEKRFRAFTNDDTLTLSGKDRKGFLWKDTKLKGVSIGYANVPLDKESIFCTALKSIDKK